MSWWEALIIAAAAAFVVGVAIYSFVRRKHGKGGCDCGCDHCRCGGCASRKTPPEK